MCVILTLLPGQSIDFDKLDNAIANNSHGYGVIFHDRTAQRLEVRKDFKDGGTDTEEVMRILEDNKDILRHLHLRNQTKGSLDLDNCHPFSVYSSNKREIYLAHNGTIYDYAPKGEDKRNDTRIFVEEFVSPLLVGFEGEFGKGDYNHPIIKKVLEKQIGTNNRLLLMSNDLDPLYCGEWKTIKNKDGSEFKASNNDYFDRIVRGSRHSVAPFRAHQPVHQVTVVSGTNSKTTTGTSTGVTTSGGTTNTGGRFCSTPQSQSSTSLVEEAKTARTEVTAITKLSDVEKIKPDYTPSKAFLSSLGTSEATFLEFGFQSFTWLRDDEIAYALKQISSQALVDLFRALIESAVGAQEEVDELVIQNQELIEENEELTQKNKSASRKIAELVQTNVQEMRKVG